MKNNTESHENSIQLVAVKRGKLIISLWLLISVSLVTAIMWWLYFRDRPVDVGEITKWTVVLDICNEGECETKGFSKGMQMHFPYDYARSSHYLVDSLPSDKKWSVNTRNKDSFDKYYWVSKHKINQIFMNFIVYGAEFIESPKPYATANATERGYYSWSNNSKWNKEWASYYYWDGNRAQLNINYRTKLHADKHWMGMNNTVLKLYKMELRTEKIMGLSWYQPHGQPTPGAMEFFIVDSLQPRMIIKCKQPTSAADIRTMCKMRTRINDDLEIEVSFPRSLLPKWRQFGHSVQRWLRTYLVSEPKGFLPEPKYSSAEIKKLVSKIKTIKGI